MPLDLSHLNRDQQRAARHYEGPLLVVAGAGSGKTRTLTYRIANLVLTHQVEPEHILAVTFTNKAAREMKSRIEHLFAAYRAVETYGREWDDLGPAEQTRLRSEVSRRLIRPMWIGTFHSLFARILRSDIAKFADEQQRQWQQNFSIWDDSDCQSTVKTIVLKELNLDERKFNPRSVRAAISGAKNQGLSPEQFAAEEPGFRGRTIADVYRRYQTALAANNALDFDDLIRIPVLLFKQDAATLNYWHCQFRHVLVDEYQDTNPIQYDLVRLLVTNNQAREAWQWQDRSVFAVGDGDQSIYAFRGADYRILLNFQENFGDRLPDNRTQTLIKLEENYRSTATIINVANSLIERNTERIDKVLRPTHPDGDQIRYFRAQTEDDEARFVVSQIRSALQNQLTPRYGDFAILYRTNAQSRPFEEYLLRWQIPYTVVGGLKFYERKEIKDVLSYLRLLDNPFDSASLLRIINTPRRGIGATTIAKLQEASQQLSIPLWDLLIDTDSVQSLLGRSSRAVVKFVEDLLRWRTQVNRISVAELLKLVLLESGYTAELEAQGNDEAENRLQNIQELFNAVQQFQEESEDHSLTAYLAQVSLTSSLEDMQTDSVSLMTLHSAKGLEFPVVFLVGLEQGLFPNFRAQDDPAAMEEERRLCYVGITRAEAQLYICHADARRLYGERQSAIPSVFLSELPTEFIHSVGDTALPQPKSRSTSRPTDTATFKRNPNPSLAWRVGDRLSHDSFGIGEVTHVFGSGEKVTLGVKFHALGQQKILDPRLAPVEKL